MFHNPAFVDAVDAALELEERAIEILNDMHAAYTYYEQATPAQRKAMGRRVEPTLCTDVNCGQDHTCPRCSGHGRLNWGVYFQDGIQWCFQCGGAGKAEAWHGEPNVLQIAA